MTFLKLILPLLLLTSTALRASFQYSTTSCPHLCKCSRTAQQTRVDCDNGAMTSYDLQAILNALPTSVTHFSMRPPKGLPNKLSFTTEFRRFRKLESLTLHNCGIRALGKGALEGMKALRVFDISRNDIRELSVATFRGVRRLEILDLSDNRLGENEKSRLPTGTFATLSNLRHLTLANNGLRTLPVGLFGQSKTLTYLDVSRNALDGQSLKTLLTDVPSLLSLSLAHCSLTSLDEDLFNAVPLLSAIDLSNNDITMVPSLALRQLDYLRVLDLSRNGIHSIDAHAFYEHKLDELKMSGNMLGGKHVKGIHPKAFGRASIRSLDLSNNSYSTFNSSIVLSAGATLRSLDLSSNPLHQITKLLIKDLTLSSLSLSNCGLHHLMHHLPEDYETIQTLNISHNGIPSIPHSNLRTMSDLSILDISFNRLLDMPAYLYGQNDNGDALLTYAHGNPFDCHCHILPLRTYLQKSAVLLGKYAVQVQCISPVHLMHQPIVDIGQPDDCAVVFSAITGMTQRSELGIFAGMLCGFIVILALSITLTYWTRMRGRKGTYRTHELSSALSHTNSLSSRESELTNPSRLLSKDERMSSPEGCASTQLIKPPPPRREVLF